MKIVFTGGGTGGHILPLIAVARELRRSSPLNTLQMFYLGPDDQFSRMLFLQEGVSVSSILSGKLRRYWNPQSVLQNIFDVTLKIPAGILVAFWKLFFIAPDVILSKGGYGALPVTIAGWILRIPIFLHESDVAPGLANQIAGRFAVEIFASFPYTEQISKKKIILVGNPIRKEILTGSPKEAASIFHLQGGRPILLIVGGSQGAQRINDILLQIIGEMTKSVETIHQTGEKNFQQVKTEAMVMLSKEQQEYYHPVPFLKETELRHAYAAADFIISRAGSGSIFEIAALGKPSLLIPLPEAAQAHQLKNAYSYGKTGAAIVLEESNLTPHFFWEKIRTVLSSPKISSAMSQAAQEFARPNAARIIATYILEYLKK
ncbi:MAG: UDP-N-acetylglucosamine--N-acetylmuramyl-(pentapeptide) pyrophosphoryl-undecaprenol N-acetylglucosamine transferase [Candidatus Wildermuthbacteria bacterium]|nr:UDP-N-acetylglucosamine--N-acetylmuramyl-(pentapeptide) pyrophosphoryl-undecaprenol N-acetylglucosamine transferase [Candidatus Wildermuthbacteria bacterium]